MKIIHCPRCGERACERKNRVPRRSIKHMALVVCLICGYEMFLCYEYADQFPNSIKCRSKTPRIDYDIEIELAPSGYQLGDLPELPKFRY